MERIIIPQGLLQIFPTVETLERAMIHHIVTNQFNVKNTGESNNSVIQ